MTTPQTNVLRQRLVHVIRHRSTSSSDASAVAVAVRRAHDELTAVFAPLISAAGVAALSGRAFDLARREYPAGGEEEVSPADEPFGAISHWLERQPASVATEAAAAMFTTFAELLAALIGEPLTMRYLEKAWPDAFSDARPKGKKA